MENTNIRLYYKEDRAMLKVTTAKFHYVYRDIPWSTFRHLQVLLGKKAYGKFWKELNGRSFDKYKLGEAVMW
jgi:hypothetical protein